MKQHKSSYFSTFLQKHHDADYIQGVVWFLLTGLLCVLVNTLMRVLNESFGYHPLQLVFFYSLTGLLPFVPSIIRNPSKYVVARKKLYGLRGILEVTGFTLVFFAVISLPFAMFTVLTFTTPIIASVLAVYFLGERMTPQKWLSLLVGFAGIVVVSEPGNLTFNWAVLLPLGASACFAACVVCIRKLAHTDPPSRIASMTLLLMSVLSLPLALMYWQTPEWSHLPYLALLALFVSSVQFCVGKALQKIELTVAQPYMFLNLIWSSLIGFYLFSEPVSIYTFIGATMIIVAIIIGISRRRLTRPTPQITAVRKLQ